MLYYNTETMISIILVLPSLPWQHILALEHHWLSQTEESKNHTSHGNTDWQISGLNIRFWFYSKVRVWKKGTCPQLHYEVSPAFWFQSLSCPKGKERGGSESKCVLQMRSLLLPWQPRRCHTPWPLTLSFPRPAAQGEMCQGCLCWLPFP